MSIAGLRDVPRGRRQNAGGAEAKPDDVANADTMDWEDAYLCLRDEMESLRRDNAALLSEIQGRKRSQYGSRSERVTPEELLVGLRKLKEVEPAHIPAGMLEALERQCAERAQERQKRAQKREEKRQKAAFEAAQRAVSCGGSDNDGDDDGGGGGGRGNGRGGKRHAEETTAPQAQAASVIPIRKKGHRNACLVGLEKKDQVIPVPAEDRVCPDCAGTKQLIGYQDSHMLDLIWVQIL